MPAPAFNTARREVREWFDMVTLNAGISTHFRYHALFGLTTREAFMPPICIEYVWP
jgi:hypothetical protein